MVEEPGPCRPGSPNWINVPLDASTRSRFDWRADVDLTKAWVDITSAHAITQSLAARPAAEGDVHLDVTSLIFIDISGIRAIVSAAEKLGEGRRILLHGLPAQLARVMSIVGWAEAPTLAICEGDHE